MATKKIKPAVAKHEFTSTFERHAKWLRMETGGVRANLRGADLNSMDLRGADLRRADLSRSDMRWADLRRADLRGADLREADLTGARLDDAKLSGAKVWLGDMIVTIE
jgi:uncharacterized protein YjbI with pentapeptide repeats